MSLAVLRKRKRWFLLAVLVSLVVLFALGYHWMPDRRWNPPAHRGAGNGADVAGR